MAYPQDGGWRSQDAEMRALFAALDKDKNGYIDKNELRLTMSEVGLDLSEEDLDTMMKAAGVVIKHRIFYEDFVKMMAGKIGQSQRKAAIVHTVHRDDREPSLYSICEGEDEDPDIQAMRVAFSMFDLDGDGQISVQEVHDTMTSLGIKINLKEVKMIVKKVDTDCDGSISFDEFRQAMTRHQAAEQRRSNTTPVREQELRDAFLVFDKDKDGFLNAYDLRSTMQQLGLVLTEDDIHAMMKSVGIGPHGKICYFDFCKIYDGKTTMNAERQIGSHSTNNKLSKRQETELRAVFSIFDMDHDGYITMDEVVQVLVSMGFLPSPACIEDVFRQVDLDGNGKIDFREFLLLVRNYERPLPEDVEMKEMFNALDKDKNGYVDREELKSSFADLGMPLTDADVREMMEEAHVHGDRIFYEDFVQMMSGQIGALPVLPSATATPDSIPHQPHPERIRPHGVVEARAVMKHQHSTHSDKFLVEPPLHTLVEDVVSNHTSSCSPTLKTAAVERKLPRTNHERDASLEVRDFFCESTSSESTPLRDSGWASREKTCSSPPNECIELRNNVGVCCDTRSPRKASMDKAPSTWVAFKVFDHNSDGYISKTELHRTMNGLGIELSKEDLDVMMAEADINKDGKIDYSEFSKLMNGSFEGYAKRAAQVHERRNVQATTSHSNGTVSSGTGHTQSPGARLQRQKTPRREAEQAEQDMRTAFKVFDIDGDGLIDPEELRQTMQNLGEILTDRDVEAMIRAVDRNDDGKIDYEEFILMMRCSK